MIKKNWLHWCFRKEIVKFHWYHNNWLFQTSNIRNSLTENCINYMQTRKKKFIWKRVFISKRPVYFLKNRSYNFDTSWKFTIRQQCLNFKWKIWKKKIVERNSLFLFQCPSLYFWATIGQVHKVMQVILISVFGL